ncbi:MAG: hypothetical protein ACYTFA_00680 [Planctomycetota bacterium]
MNKASNSVDRIRTLVKFVIVWLIALYVFEVVRQNNWFIGAGAVIVAALVNTYARKKAAAAVETNLAFHFWLYMPLVVLFGLPLLFKVVIMLTGEEDVTWWHHLGSLLPFVLKLGVPVAALLWVYVALGRLRTPEDADAAPTA